MNKRNQVKGLSFNISATFIKILKNGTNGTNGTLKINCNLVYSSKIKLIMSK